MRLGVTVVPSPDQPIGFDPLALRALRPSFVRFVVTRPEDLLPWIAAARRARLQILWCVPPERLGGTWRSRLAVDTILGAGMDVTAGLEIGDRPWAHGYEPTAFIDSAVHLAASADWPRDPAGRWPLLLGVGADGSPQASAWLQAVLRAARDVPALGTTFHAVTIATAPGRPWRTIGCRATQARVMDTLGLPLAVTRVGWPLGSPVHRWWALREAAADVGAAIAAGLRGDGVRTHLEADVSRVTSRIRRRWILEAHAAADRLGASHFCLEADRAVPGVHHWSLYHPPTGIADPVWQTLVWRDVGRSTALRHVTP